MNLSTLIVLVLLGAALALAIYSLVRPGRKGCCGGGGCSGGCGSCPMAGKCHGKKRDKEQ